MFYVPSACSLPSPLQSLLNGGEGALTTAVTKYPVALCPTNSNHLYVFGSSVFLFRKNIISLDTHFDWKILLLPLGAPGKGTPNWGIVNDLLRTGRE